MFAALEAIKNTLFSFNPIPSTVAHPVDTISSIVNTDDDNDSTTEPIIDQGEPITKESEQMDIFDKHPYTVTNLVSGEPEDFHYLHGDNLAQTYDFCLNKSSVAITVHICMVAMDFQCNYSGEHLPFLRFLMEYGSSTIDFPKCEIICNMAADASENRSLQNVGSPHIFSSNANENDESKYDEMDTYFHNECKKRMLDFFVIEGQTSKMADFGERLNKSYRGYKEMREGELVVVFDITDFLNIPLRTSRNPGWMILDDFENRVLPISPKVLQFFRETEYMKQIRDPLNNLVETPKSMYLYDFVQSRFMMKAEKSEWLEPRSFHPTYGNFYYLKSLNNLSSIENPQIVESYRKCAVFLKNYADLLENARETRSSENEGFSHIFRSSTKENGEHIAEPELKEVEKSEAVGGSTNSDISLNDLEIDDDLELSSDSEEETEQYNYASTYDKTEIQNNLPFISLIMFSEKGEPIYCVKTESIFIEL
jgi:hypothetical protein